MLTARSTTGGGWPSTTSSPPGIWLRWVISTRAEASARASVAGFESIGEQFLVFDSLGMLAGVAEARGDLEGAATTYEQLLERRPRPLAW